MAKRSRIILGGDGRSLNLEANERKSGQWQPRVMLYSSATEKEVAGMHRVHPDEGTARVELARLLKEAEAVGWERTPPTPPSRWPHFQELPSPAADREGVGR